MAKPDTNFVPAHTVAYKIERNNHNVSRRYISENALRVLKRLGGAGFEAYLVGGAVRDMMLGTNPKDFDIATDATPEEIRKLFKNARIIGRRFRIVHVLFGPEVIEVTTFRGHHDAIDDTNFQNKSVITESGMLLRDNVFGSVEEDAIRRDFTVNAIYYSCKDFCVYDFTNGIEDINKQTLRLIGDPATRFKEDPVRILRAIRFAAKLGFSIEKTTEAAIQPHAELLRNISPARLFDEFLKLFTGGHAVATYEQLKKYDLLHYLVFSSETILQNNLHEMFIKQALENTDKRIHIGKSVTPAFIYSVFLWPAFIGMQREFENDGLPPLVASSSAASIAFQQQAPATTIPKRIQITIKEIWDLQTQLNNRSSSKAFKLLEHPRFRAGYDFLLLREQVGAVEPGLGEWWTKFQFQNTDEQQQSILELGTPPGKRRRRKPRKRKPVQVTTV